MNNNTKSWQLHTKLLTDGLVVRSIPDVLWQLFCLTDGSGEVWLEETDFVDTCVLYT